MAGVADRRVHLGEALQPLVGLGPDALGVVDLAETLAGPAARAVAQILDNLVSNAIKYSAGAATRAIAADRGARARRIAEEGLAEQVLRVAARPGGDHADLEVVEGIEVGAQGQHLVAAAQAHGQHVAGRGVQDRVFGEIHEDREAVPLAAADHHEVRAALGRDAHDLGLAQGREAVHQGDAGVDLGGLAIWVS